MAKRLDEECGWEKICVSAKIYIVEDLIGYFKDLKSWGLKTKNMTEGIKTLIVFFSTDQKAVAIVTCFSMNMMVLGSILCLLKFVPVS